jgi:hypothetical protein
MRRSILDAGTDPPGKKPGRYVPWVDVYAGPASVAVAVAVAVTPAS